MDAWWRDADFGFVKKVKDDLVTVCEPRHKVQPLASGCMVPKPCPNCIN